MGSSLAGEGLLTERRVSRDGAGSRVVPTAGGLPFFLVKEESEVKKVWDRNT